MRRISLAFFIFLCYTSHARRVGISVLQRLPKPLRRVRLPYPAPKGKAHRQVGFFFWCRVQIREIRSAQQIRACAPKRYPTHKAKNFKNKKAPSRRSFNTSSLKRNEPWSISCHSKESRLISHECWVPSYFNLFFLQICELLSTLDSPFLCVFIIAQGKAFFKLGYSIRIWGKSWLIREWTQPFKLW